MSEDRPKTAVRVKARPNSRGFIYGTLEDRRKLDISWVVVHFHLPHGVEATSQYEIEELEEVVT